MITIQNQKKIILDLTGKIFQLIETANNIPSISKSQIINWKSTLEKIEKNINEDIIRVAVVGSIKSGKSTFINSFFKGDYLKRGAGVVTSIVTRIRKGSKLQALLFFKDLKQINNELMQSVSIFNELELNKKDYKFDIQNKEDRVFLHNLLENLSIDKQIVNDLQNKNTFLIEAFLNGYDLVQNIITSESKELNFNSDSFHKHQDYVGNQYLSSYLKDILVNISSDNDIPDNIEIADCQGCDSPNPLHIIMIQEYLLKANFILYVISSRNGVRNSDIHFLNIIKKTGIIDNLIFIVNCDLSEHDNINNLTEVIEKIKKDLSLIKTDPDIFAFSSLLNLYDSLQNSLSKKEQLRLKQWKMDKEMCSFSSNEYARFHEQFLGNLIKNKSNIFLKNNLERIRIIASELHEISIIHSDILRNDKKGAQKIIQSIKAYQDRFLQVEKLAKDSLNGAIIDIKRSIAINTDKFFDNKYGELSKQLIDNIKDYTISFEKYKKTFHDGSYQKAFYSIFKDFKIMIDDLMISIVNPMFMNFIIKQEQLIKDQLTQINSLYKKIIQDSFQNNESLYINIKKDFNDNIDSIDIDQIKNSLKMEIPILQTTLNYGAKIRSEALLNLGLFNLSNFFRKIFRKKTSKQFNEFKALKRSIKPMKKETIKSIFENFQDIRENIKFQYFYKLLDQSSEILIHSLSNSLKVLNTDLKKMSKLNDLEDDKKDKLICQLADLKSASLNIIEELNIIKN